MMMSQTSSAAHPIQERIRLLAESAGQAQGKAVNAAAGLRVATGKAAVPGGATTWAYNPEMSEWQAVHVIVSGDNLWNMSGTYYGTKSQAGMYSIRDVRQNLPIVGQDMRQAIPGDALLIPSIGARSGLSAPSGEVVVPGAPPAPPTEPAPVPPVVTDPGGIQLPPWLGGIIRGIPVVAPPEEPPPSGPPPVTVTPPGVPAIPGLPTVPAPVPPPEEKPKEKFWTTGKIVGAAVVGLLLVGGIGYAVTRKPKRARRRRKKSS